MKKSRAAYYYDNLGFDFIKAKILEECGELITAIVQSFIFERKPFDKVVEEAVQVALYLEIFLSQINQSTINKYRTAKLRALGRKIRAKKDESTVD